MISEISAFWKAILEAPFAVVQSLRHVWLFATPWPCQTPLCMDLPGKNPGLPFLPQRISAAQGLSSRLPRWQAESLPLSRWGALGTPRFTFPFWSFFPGVSGRGIRGRQGAFLKAKLSLGKECSVLPNLHKLSKIHPQKGDCFAAWLGAGWVLVSKQTTTHHHWWLL